MAPILMFLWGIGEHASPTLANDAGSGMPHEKGQAIIDEAMQFHGTATNSRRGAAVLDGARRVYCLDRPHWPAKVDGRRVMVEGHPERIDPLHPMVSPTNAIDTAKVDGDVVIRNCSSWLARQDVGSRNGLLDWLQDSARSLDGGRCRLRLAVLVSFADPDRLALGRAYVQDPVEVSNRVALHLDDTALGTSLLERLREICPKTERGCLVWLEGTLGRLLELPPEQSGTTDPDPFAVLGVFGLVHEVGSRVPDAFVEIP